MDAPSTIQTLDKKLAELLEEFKVEQQKLIQKENELKERELLLLESKEKVNFEKVIKLDVGGYTFRTTIDTLRKYPNCLLSAMFSGHFDFKPQEDGHYFIDRDGTHFRHILNFLRDGSVPTLPSTDLEELIREAEFYNMNEFITLLKEKNQKNVLRYEDQTFEPKIPSVFTVINKRTVKKTAGSNQWTDAPVFLSRKINSGKVYWEIVIDHVNNDRTGMVIGITGDKVTSHYNIDVGIGMSAYKYGGVTGTDVFTAYNGDRIGVFVDFDNLICTFYRNGKKLNLSAPIEKKDYYPVVHIYYVNDQVSVAFPNPPQ